MTARPVRIQRKRTKGFFGPDAAGNGLPVVYVNRPLRFGNPFVIPRGATDDMRQRAVDCYRSALLGGRLPYTVDDVRRGLRGQNIGCFCRLGQPCHADVLLEIANGEE